MASKTPEQNKTKPKSSHRHKHSKHKHSQHKRKRAKEELDTQITKQQADVEQLEARQAERDAKRSKGMPAAEGSTSRLAGLNLES